MFTQLLFRTIKVGEKAFHVLTDISLNPDEWEKLGIEIIKDAALIKEQIEKTKAEAQPPENLPTQDNINA